MRIIGIIPARYGSTRFEGKPLINILGKTMIQRTYEQAKKSELIEEVYVATDDERIKQNAESFGAQVIMTSKECACGTDRIAEAVQQLGLSDNDLVVNIQGDEPVVNPSSIDAAIKPFLSDPTLKVTTLAIKIKNALEYSDPSVAKVVTDKDGFALYFSRAGIPYNRSNHTEVYKQLGIYVFRKHFLVEFSKMKPTRYELTEKLEQLRIIENGHKIKVVETDYDSPSINVPADLDTVLDFLKKGK